MKSGLKASTCRVRGRELDDLYFVFFIFILCLPFNFFSFVFQFFFISNKFSYTYSMLLYIVHVDAYII
jgi:hypothetical protein